MLSFNFEGHSISGLRVRCVICWVELHHTNNTDSEVREEGLTSNSINFIKEDQTSLLGPGHLEKLTHHPGSLHTNGMFPIVSGFTTCLSVFLLYLKLLFVSFSSRRLTSPTYFCTSSEPITLMKHASVLLATARAQRVFPVPGGPNSRTPFGGSMPRLTNLSGYQAQRWQSDVSMTDGDQIQVVVTTSAVTSLLKKTES